MRINKHDTQGTKPLLGKGELGYDDYTAGGDVGRVYVGTGSENIALAEKSEIDSHVNRVDNPHNVTKTQVGLGNVDNTADSVKNVLSATKWTTARTITLSGDVAGSVSMDGTANVSITTTVQPNSVALGTDTTGNYVAGATAGTGITVSGTAGEGWSPTIAITNVGTAGTYTKVTTNAQGQVTSGTTLSATDIPVLDASKITTGTIDAARLPSFVDDVLEYANLAGFPATGETGKIYIALDTNKTYRWSGSVYVYITSGAVDSVNGQTGVVTITDITGNAGTATTLQTARTISLSGDVIGSVSFNGSSNVDIVSTVADNSHNHTVANVTGLQTALDNKVDDSEKGSANGVATLDVNGKVVLTQIPDSVLGQLEYQGVWDFTTLPTATQKGQYWIASVSGNGYDVGDWAVWNGTAFDKVDNTDAVASVAGRTGNVVLTKSDVALDLVDNTADSAKNVLSATKLTTTRNIALTGDVTGNINFDGSANVSIATTIAANSVALGTDTTGNYVAGATAGTGISISGTAGEGWSPTITNTAPNVTTDISVTHDTSSVTVNSSDGLDGTINAASQTLAGIMTAADKTKLDGIATGATANTGTVTSIATSGAITGGTITTTGTISHSTADGFLHVPATGTTNNGKVLTAGATAGSLSWTTIPAGITDHTLLSNIGTNTHAQIDTALTRLANTSGTNTGDNAVNSNYENDYRASNFVAGTNYLAPNGSAAALTNFPILNQNTSGNAGTATKLQTSRNIALAGAIVGSVNFDGSADVNISTTLGAQSFIQSSGLSSSWGSTNGTSTGAINAIMGTSSSATWLLSGTSGGVFRSGIQSLDSNGTLRLYSNSNYVEINGNQISGNISTATALATGRTIGMTGDVTWTSASFNGSGNVTGTSTLATITDSGTGTFKKITTDTKGRVTGTQAVAQADITGLLGAGSITNTMIANTAVANLSGTNTGDQTITLTGDVTGSGTGSFATTLANSGVTAGTYSKITVDGKGRVTAGLVPTMEDIPDATFKRSVKAATTANITLSAPQTIDGIALVAGDRVLVKDQTTTSQNGIYIVQSAAWTRALDANTSSKIASAIVAVDTGTANGGLIFDNDFKTTDTLGTTGMPWHRIVDTNYTIPVAQGGTGSTTAAGARTNLGATTVGSNLLTLTNPSAVTFPRINADNTVSTLDATTFRTAIGAGTSSTVGTVTSVGGTGSVSGLTLSGTVTSSGNLTLGGTLSVTPSNFASQTANTVLAAPNGVAGVPTFRSLVASDIPVLNQNTTGTASNVTGVVAVVNGGTGSSTVSGATVFAGPVANTSAPANAAPSFRNLELTDIPGSAFKKSVRCATTAALTLNAATATIDGVTLAATDRVLIKNQATASQNGIYYNVTTTTWARTVDSDAAGEIASAVVAVDEGTVNGGKLFTTTFKPTDTLGTTAMNWFEVLDDSRLLTSGSTSVGAIRYSGTTSTAGQFDGGTTTPTGTSRLNYGGYFYPSYLNLTGSADTTTAATHYYVETGSDGFVRPKTLANVKAELLASAALTGTPTAPTAATTVSSTQVATTAFATPRTSTTGSAVIPSGTTAQRDGTPVNGYIRYNTTLNSFEGYVNGTWGNIGGSGGATGGGADKVFYENDQVVTTSYSIAAGKNAMSAGDVTINTGVTVTVPTGSRWVII